MDTAERFQRITHDEWRRWADRIRRSRLIYVSEIKMQTEFAGLMRRVLGCQNLAAALGGPVEVLDELPVSEESMCAYSDSRLQVLQNLVRGPDLPDGRRCWVRIRHDGKIDDPPQDTSRARVIA